MKKQPSEPSAITLAKRAVSMKDVLQLMLNFGMFVVSLITLVITLLTFLTLESAGQPTPFILC